MTAVIVYSVFEVLVLFSELNFDEIGISRKVFRKERAEPVFLNVYGAQESIPKKELRQPM
jgi:hypothetical protein